MVAADPFREATLPGVTPPLGGFPRPGHGVFLGEFAFDSVGGRLTHRGEQLTLRPKTAAVLSLLIDRAGDVVAKPELLSTVWPDGFVGDGVLSVCINELRRAFGDDSREPHVIETVHRVGYRLLVEPSAEPPPLAASHRMVGRTRELAMLTDWWERARRGGPIRVGFVAAETGAGKTALLEELVTRLQDQTSTLVGWGQCIEGIDAGEPYLPLLDALTSLCHGPRSKEVLAVLRRCAVSWLVQLPGVLDEESRAELRRAVPRSSTDSMLSEFAVAVEELSAAYPLLLVVEDLHNADRPTIELISYLARRRSQARFLLLGSCQRAQIVDTAHRLRSLMQDLAARGLCQRMVLQPWSVADVGTYVATWFAPRAVSPELTAEIAERTEGNPLFVVALCRHLDESGLLAAGDEVVRAAGGLRALGVPDEVRLMLQRQIESLDPTDRRLLEVAAAVGDEFSVEAVSAGLDGELSVVEVEERCAALARKGSLLRAADPIAWPDGTLTGRCRFAHEMYRELLYDTLGPARRVQVHRAIGARLAAAYGADSEQIAPELATHHERGRDYPAAVAELTIAARVAMSRAAYPEAHDYLHHALSLLGQVPDGAERERLELQLRRASVVAVGSVWGWRQPEAVVSCLRLSELAVACDDVPALVTALLGLHNVAMVRGDGKAREDAAAEVLSLAQRTRDQTAGLVAHLLQSYVSSRVGDCEAMWEHAQRILELAPGRADPELALVLGEEPAVAAHQLGAIALWQLGYPDQARRHVLTALADARMLAIPTDIARALWYAAVVHTLRGDARSVAELGVELTTISARHDLDLWRAGGSVLGGWAAVMLGDVAGGLEQLRTGLAGWARFARLGVTFHSCVAAAAYLDAGRVEDARAVVAAGLAAVAADGERQSEPELLRLHGELLLLAGEPERAEQELRRSLTIARQRSARGFQLRTAVSLATLWSERGRAAEATELLAGVLDRFDEGHDTCDLREAAALVLRLKDSKNS